MEPLRSTSKINVSAYFLKEMEQKFDEGRAIGLKKAFEETKGESDTDVELVKLLLEHKIGIDIIVQHTDLPIKQIEDLKRDIAAA